MLVVRVRDFLHVPGEFSLLLGKQLLQVCALTFQIICFLLKLRRLLLQLLQDFLLESLELSSHLRFLIFVRLVRLLSQIDYL